MITPTLSATIKFLRFPLLMGVVLIHCNYLPDLPYITEHEHIFTDFISVFHPLILGLCVPTFFFISGMLFFRNGPNLTKHDYIEKLKRRYHTLIIPYLLWNVIGLLFLLLKKSPVTSAFPQYDDFALTPWNILKGFFAQPHVDHPYDFPLWFIRNLIIIVLVSPLLGIILKLCKALSPLLFLALLFVVDYCAPDLSDFGIISNAFFFICGGALFNFIPTLTRINNPTWSILIYIILYIITLRLDNPSIESLMYPVCMLSGCLALVHIGNYCTHQGLMIPAKLSDATFFIYASHGLYSSITRKIIYTMLPLSTNAICFIDYILSFILLFGISYIFYLIGLRLAPRFTAILCGGR